MRCHRLVLLDFVFFVIILIDGRMSAVTTTVLQQKTTFQNGFDHWTSPQGQSWSIKTWQGVKADFNQIKLPDPPSLASDSKEGNVSSSINLLTDLVVQQVNNVTFS